METGKTGKYFKYAIGEIVLVVIGILIALQINNWNEDRKDRKVELKILQSINSDLLEDIQNLKVMMVFDSIMIEQNNTLFTILENKNSIYNTEMEPLFGNINRYGVFYPQKIGYESLKSSGLEILQSDSLRAAIVTLYDFHYGFVSETLDLKKQIYLTTNPIFVGELRTTGGPNEMQSVSYKEPVDFNALKENLNFINHIRHIYYERINFLKFTGTTLLQMKKVQAKITEDIKSIKND